MKLMYRMKLIFMTLCSLYFSNCESNILTATVCVHAPHYIGEGGTYGNESQYVSDVEDELTNDTVTLECNEGEAVVIQSAQYLLPIEGDGYCVDKKHNNCSEEKPCRCCTKPIDQLICKVSYPLEEIAYLNEICNYGAGPVCNVSIYDIDVHVFKRSECPNFSSDTLKCSTQRLTNESDYGIIASWLFWILQFFDNIDNCASRWTDIFYTCEHVGQSKCISLIIISANLISNNV